MKLTIYCFLFFISCQLFGQNDSLSIQNLNVQNSTIIRNHLAKYYNVPDEVFDDSTVIKIQYAIKITVDEEGKISQHEIQTKNIECKSCELELKRVLKTIPTLSPYIFENRKTKAIFSLPFTILLQ